MKLPSVKTPNQAITAGNHLNKSFQFIHFNETKLITGQTSFNRCDFRGARFTKTEFLNVEFPRSDLNHATFEMAKFENASFDGAGINKSLFENCIFKRCTFIGAGIDGCSFEKCQFMGCVFEKTGVRNSRFRDCVLNDHKWEKGTSYNLTYSYCTFDKIDISGLYSYELYFRDCQFKKLEVCPDYLGTYCFNPFPKEIGLNYRSSKLGNFGDDNTVIKAMIENYSSNGRVYEAFNLAIHLTTLSSNSIPLGSILKESLAVLVSSKDQLWFKENFEGLVKCVKFYIQTERFKLNDVTTFFSFMDKLQEKSSFFETSSTFFELQQSLLQSFNHGGLDNKILLSLDSDSTLRAQASIYYNRESCGESINNTLNDLLSLIAISRNNVGLDSSSNQIDVLGIRTGSIEVLISLGFATAYALLHFVRKFSDDHQTKRVKVAFANRSIELIERAKTPKELAELINVIKTFDSIRPSDKAISKNRMPDDINLKL